MNLSQVTHTSDGREVLVSLSNSPAFDAPSVPARSQLVIWLAILSLLGIWPAVSNGQPFFYGDTPAYLRGADLAISKALGPRFATDWAKDPRRNIEPENTASTLAMAKQQPGRRVVLAGRSIIYGVLLYFGEVFGGMWFSIIVQSLTATYLLFLFIVRTLGLSFRYFLICCLVLSLASSLPFFISYLMPDVFAGFLVLGFAILATGWDRLNKFERVIISATLLFCVLVHTSHLILLAGLAIITIGYAALATRGHSINIRVLTSVSAACIVTALLWEVGFSFAVNRALGSPPVRPPFVLAKLVSMLGEPAIAQACASNRFVVCQFQDRFPIDTASFLWSTDEHIGVFNIADPRTKQLLDTEQARFALTIIPPNIGHFVAGISLDGLRQLMHFSLDEYFYTPVGLNWYKERMPTDDFDRMARTVAARSEAYAVFGRTVLYATAIVGGIIAASLLIGVFAGKEANRGEHSAKEFWLVATWIVIAGILLNAIICGGFSDVNNRYEARVIWLIQLCAMAGIGATETPRKIASAWGRKAQGHYLRTT